MWSYSKIVETAGFVAIVLTLLFLGYELKRANDIAEAEAGATVTASVKEFNLIVGSDQELSEIFFGGLSDFQSLSEHHKRRFQLLMAYIFTNQETIWKFYDKGMISDADAEYYIKDVCPILTAQPEITDIWLRHYRENSLKGFTDFAIKWCPNLRSSLKSIQE